MNTIAVPRQLVLRLSLAVLGALLFMTVAAVQGALRPGYDVWHQAVSALSLGPGGWIQTLNFAVLGLLITSTVPVWRRVLAGGRAAVWFPTLTAVLGLSFLVAGFLPQDPAPGYDPEGLALQAPTTIGLLHLAVAGVAAASSVASCFVMATRFAADPHWRGWATYSRVMALLTILCVAVYGVWSTRSTGFAGTFERAAILIPCLWGFTLLRRLWSGTPFMHASTSGPSSAVLKGIRG